MARYEEYNQEQSFFICIDVDANFPKGSYVRLLNDFFEEQVSMEPFKNKRKNDILGTNAKPPEMMLKVIFYAFSMGIYSMRKICAEFLPFNINFIYLAAYKTADHSTFSRFINLYKNGLEKVNKIIECYEQGKLDKSDKKQINLTDMDSPLVKKENKTIQGYNCQAMVNEQGIILANEIPYSATDRNLPINMSRGTGFRWETI
jgi:transposase